MSTLVDGINNVNNLTAQIESLKANAADYSSTTPDTETAILQMEQNFSQMLNSLMFPSSGDNDSSRSYNAFSAFTGGNQDSLYSVLGNSTASQSSFLSSESLLAAQRLSALEENSTLLGQEVIYTDSETQDEKTGIVSRILVTQAALPVLVLENGDQIPVADVLGIKKQDSDGNVM